MKKPTTRFYLALIILAMAFSACHQKPIQTSSFEENVQVREVLFLTLKVFDTEKGVKAKLLDLEIREDYSNPLGLNDSSEGRTYKCEIIDENGLIILTSKMKSPFSYKTDDGIPYTFLKISESLPIQYNSCVVSVQVSKGVWQELYSAKLK